MITQVWTVRTLLAWSTPWLTLRGVEAARLDSELLLAKALNLRRIDLFLDPHRPLIATELAQFKILLKRRAVREPIAYILGHREFWGIEFIVCTDVLIPRPETELLVETTIARYLDKETPLEILELCTGSGAVLCALLHEYPQAKGTGTDLSSQALAVARSNAQKTGVAQRIHWIQSDLDVLLTPTKLFDLIIANPPYIASADLTELEPEVRDWEPRMALDGGLDGLQILTKIPAIAQTRLKPGGLLLMEIGHDQGQAVIEFFLQAGLTNIKILNDYNNIPRVVAGNAKFIQPYSPIDR